MSITTEDSTFSCKIRPSSFFEPAEKIHVIDFTCPVKEYTGGSIQDCDDFDTPHGKGLLMFSNGYAYRGNFEYGIAEGYGEYFYVQQDEFEEFYMDDSKQGRFCYKG